MMDENVNYLKKTTLGQYRCTLCDALLRNEDHYTAHADGKQHKKKVELLAMRKEQIQKEIAEKLVLAQQERHDAHQAQVSSLTGAGGNLLPNNNNQNQRNNQNIIPPKTNVGAPQAKIQVEPLGSNGLQSQIMFTIHYPLCGTQPHLQQQQQNQNQKGGEDDANKQQEALLQGMRPMHRWLGAYEQKMDVPADPNKMYLVFACEPYQTVSYCFPSNLAVAKADNTDPQDVQRYFCRWDPIEKVYQLMFTVGHR